jgi:hypothetical protein
MKLPKPPIDKNGNWISNPNYKEIHVLHSLLNTAKIPYVMKEFMDGWQICYPVDFPIEKRVVSVIEHYGSYGHAQDTLEIMGLLTDEERKCDSVVGSLTAQDVFSRIQKHYAGVLEKEEYR